MVAWSILRVGLKPTHVNCSYVVLFFIATTTGRFAAPSVPKWFGFASNRFLKPDRSAGIAVGVKEISLSRKCGHTPGYRSEPAIVAARTESSRPGSRDLTNETSF